MHRLATVTVLASAILLSNCVTTTPGQVSSITTSFLTAVDQTVATVCQAVPEAAAIISLVNSGIGLSVGGVASAFCSAFANAVPAPAPAAARLRAKRFAHRFGRRFGASNPTYMCAGAICGWRLR